MASSVARDRDEIARAPARASRALDPGELAWLVVLPCAALVALAVLLLGPPLGDALLAPRGDRFWPGMEVDAEPVEHGRFLLALLAAPLGAAAVWLLARRPPRLRPRLARTLIVLTQMCAMLFLALMLLAQHNVLLRSYVAPSHPATILSAATIVAAAAAALLSGLALRRREVAAWLTALARETRGRRAVLRARRDRAERPVAARRVQHRAHGRHR